MSKKEVTLKERLVRVETLLTNHLHHHEIWFKCVIAPMAVGVFLSTISAMAILAKLFIFTN